MAREIEVNENTIDENDNSTEVSIEIDGNPYRFWQTANIKFSFDTIADTFSISGPYNPENKNIKKLFKPYSYKEIILYIGGNKVLTGVMLTPRHENNSNSRIITIDGYSTPGILEDSTVSANSWPVEFDGLNLKEIAEKLSRPFGIKVVFDGDPGGKFEKNDKIRISPDQKIGTFIAGLAKERGFVLSSDVNGNLLFQKTTTVPANITIAEGSYPYIRSSSQYNGQRRYSDVTALSTNFKKGAGEVSTVSDPELLKNGVSRHMVFKAGNTNSGNLKNAAIAKLGRIFAESASLQVDVIGFYPPGESQVWKDNKKIFYRGEGDQILTDTEFLIRNAELKKNQNSEETTLDLVFPESYNGEIREVFPWD